MMCIAAYFHIGNELQIMNFDQAGAKLPLLTKNGRVTFIRWGRRPHEPGVLPIGGWTSQDAIEQGLWNKFSPSLVKLPHLKLINVSYGQRYLSANLHNEQPIAGLFIHKGKEKRLYLVTLKVNPMEAITNRWPEQQYLRQRDVLYSY